MVNRLRIKMLGIATTLVVGVAFPAGIANAAPAQETNTLLNRIFDQVGVEVPSTEKESSPSQQKEDNASQDKSTEDQSSEEGKDTEQSKGQSGTEQNSQQPAKSEPSDQSANQEQGNSESTGSDQSSESSQLADQIIATGEKYLGTPYEYGADSGQTKTFDCSSFVQHVFKENGIDLPRNSRQQSKVGQSVDQSELQKGDLLFFTTSKAGGNIGHVAIYVGDGKILHTYGKGGVKYDSFNKEWLQKTYVGAKRVL